MNNDLFENLIKSNESETLDFKRQEYDFTAKAEEKKKAEFIKDVISFSNTIRNKISYIIIGIDDSKKLVGIDDITDDSILQQKIKSSVFPVPIFKYYSFDYNDKLFGILEFPIKKYQKPITSTIRLKGLNPGDVYFRRNSSNCEANGIEVIEIQEWLSKLPTNELSFQEEIYSFLKQLSDSSIKLSTILIDIYKFSKKYDLKELCLFCNRELRGLIINDNISENDIKNLKLVKSFLLKIKLILIYFFFSIALNNLTL